MKKSEPVTYAPTDTTLTIPKDLSAWSIAKGFPKYHAPVLVTSASDSDIEKLKEALQQARNAIALALPTMIESLEDEDSAVVKWLENKP